MRSLAESWRPRAGQTFLAVFLFFFLLKAPAAAQGPSAEWRTVETPSFRVHYTAPAEAWALRMAARLEAVRERVSREVGFVPAEVTDVVVMDPRARANGMALPILGRPRMLLYTTPPGPDSVIGHYRDWGEVLTVHEDVHLVHLLRPSRNRWEYLMSRLIPLGPLTQRAPRWVVEGYATRLEGSLTGYGRPNSDLRAAILRRWAQLGELPDYGRLSFDGRSWRGMSMAYLMGSAYLEWLEERAGPESLRHLWARLSAVESRSFDEAFEGVFGDAPRRLYNRFRAELTYRAMRLEDEVEPHLRAGELWQDLDWTSGPPAVSPAGDRLAMVLRARDAPSRLVVWSTGPDEEARRRAEERRRRILERDPEDVLARRAKPLRREPLYELPAHDGAEPYTPRFTDGGEAILYVRYEPDAEGFLHPDLFRWTLESGRVERLTRGADVRDPDPAPGGGWAVGVRHRHGLSQLVRVDLETGGVEALTSAAVDVVYGHPRVSPDGERLAYIRHQDGVWVLAVRELATGREVELALPERATVAFPAWSGDGRALYATVGEAGFLDVAAFDLESGARRWVTRTHGAALAPAPTPGGEALFFLGLESDGLDLRRLELVAGAAPPPLRLAAEDYVPAARPPTPPPVEPFAAGEVSEPRPYVAGRLELLPVLLGGTAPGGRGVEVGARAGDVLGRLELRALAAEGDGSARGGTLGAAWRGWPVELGLRLVAAEERLSEQPTPVPGLGRDLDAERRGFELGAAWRRRSGRASTRLEGGVYLGELEPLGAGVALDQEVLFLDAGQGLDLARGRWLFDVDLDLGLELGRTGGDDWDRRRGRLRFALGRRGGGRLALDWERRQTGGRPTPHDLLRLGGPRGSILPRGAVGGRIFGPALPAAVQTGEESESQRAGLRLGSLPFDLFYERHRLWTPGEPRSGWLALAGLELRFEIAPQPLLRLPALELRLGGAQILDAPLRDEVEWWLGLAWTP